MDITIPSVGESITEGTIARWLKKDGERVRRGQPLFELETDKATTEVPAPADGTLHIATPEGSAVAVGTVVGTLEESGDGREQPTANRTKEKTNAEQEPPRLEKTMAEQPASMGPSTSAAPPPPLSPAARRLTAEEHLQPGDLTGTGRGGLVTKEDVLRHLERDRTTARETASKKQQSETREPMSAIRLRIAQRLLASQQQTATLTTFNEADLSAIQDLRERFRDGFQKRHGVKLGMLAFFVKACVESLQAQPIINASIDGNDIVYHHDCHVGVAMNTDKGLMVPVLHHAERMSFAQVEKMIAALAEKARAGKVAVEDLQGGTFTITNGGVFGSLLSTPLLNPPQSAILGMHAIQKRPVVVEDQIVIRPMMYLALSYDHRLIDGKHAVEFLVRVKELVERPERLLLEC